MDKSEHDRLRVSCMEKLVRYDIKNMLYKDFKKT